MKPTWRQASQKVPRTRTPSTGKRKRRRKKKKNVDPDSVAPDSVFGQVVQKRSEEGSVAKHDETDLETSITKGASHKNTEHGKKKKKKEKKEKCGSR
mmetsp:Transcript_14127/g.29221  ORF Transcript_14127/g.29221 Transcript_14127/m.29221 type:complete len:97 (-) Transcript_14127:15-305(-)